MILQINNYRAIQKISNESELGKQQQLATATHKHKIHLFDLIEQHFT